MIKTFCDACGKEVKGRNINSFGYLCHLDNLNDLHGYVDDEGNGVSGREIAVQLCNKCYNVVVIEAVKKLKEIQSKNKES